MPKIIRNVIVTLFIFFLLVDLNAFCDTPPLKTLIITHYTDYFPYSFIDENNEPKGYLIDYWKLWAKKNNVSVNFVLTSRKESVELIKNGYTHIHAGIVSEPEFEEYLFFSKPILEIKTGFFALKKSNINAFDELPDSSVIGVINGCFSEKFLKNYYPGLIIKQCDNLSCLINDCIDNKISGFIFDYNDINEIEILNPKIKEFALIETLYISKLRAGVNKLNSRLFDFVKDGLKKINKDELSSIDYEWLHIQTKTVNKELWKKMLYLSLSLLLLFLIIHIFILKHQVNKKTEQIKKTLESVNAEVEKRTSELAEANIKLEIEIKKHIQIENELKSSKEKITEQSAYLEQSNITLQKVINEAQEKKKQTEQAIIENINQTILPILKKIESHNDNSIKIYSKIVQENLYNIFSSFGIKIKQMNYELSSREIEICNLIKNGLINKEIAELLNISYRSVEKHRENIRKKLNLTNQNIDIKQYLDTMF
ncbi:MAG TPA: transporter substrate-binding domain-containing protein [bacterium]|nr:transporter substrate-binding domain-containing protein [bacterium]